MNKLLLFILLAFTWIISPAQSYRANFVDTDKESSQSLWENISDNLAMHLQEWGWVRNNTLVDPHDWSQKNQVFILTDKNMGYVNTGDGTFLYDSSISGGRVHMTNQRKLTAMTITSQLILNTMAGLKSLA